MAQLKIVSLTKTYPSGVRALDNFSLEIKEGESIALFGLELSGKSTLLRMLAGLESVTQGQILLDGKDVTDLPSKERNVAYAFQNTSLDNQKSVYDNLDYGLKLRKAPAAVIDVKVKAVAEILGLSDILNRKPKTLSATIRRRVLLGRTVVRDPKVYLFDEALSGLDGELRTQTLKDLVKLQIHLGATFVYATDDIAEALTVGDRVAILSEGKLLQCDTPENLYASPVNEFVREIMGVTAQEQQESQQAQEA
ncbi:MAG: ABC transporter ATP-binding protein [Clostridia bacterium]|nr:ABC transporter ATP-binding protein [Clostridia bacterium]